ncbi:MAG: DUF5647 family protein [candidate division NC10 bacterium]
MGKDDLTRRNLDLLDDFMRYAFDHPGILDQIPPDAQVVIIPVDDPELHEENRRMATTLCARGEKVVLIKLKKSEVYPPELELLTA